MGESLSLVIGGLNREHALIFAATSVLLQVFVRYRRYAPILKFLTLVLFLYVATAFTVHIPWGKALARAFWPAAEVNRDYLFMVVAVLGTTISPYLFFWQASQEVEEMTQNLSLIHILPTPGGPLIVYHDRAWIVLIFGLIITGAVVNYIRSSRSHAFRMMRVNQKATDPCAIVIHDQRAAGRRHQFHRQPGLPVGREIPGEMQAGRERTAIRRLQRSRSRA